MGGAVVGVVAILCVVAWLGWREVDSRHTY